MGRIGLIEKTGVCDWVTVVAVPAVLGMADVMLRAGEWSMICTYIEDRQI